MKLYLYITMYIFVKSSFTQEIYETVKATAGHIAEIPCNVTPKTSGDKLNILAWYKNGTRTAIYSNDFRGYDSESDSDRMTTAGRYRLVKGEDVDRLMIQNLRPDDAGLYYCVADFAASPTHKTYVQLTVVEPPERLWVVHENGSRVATATAGSAANMDLGPYYVGDTLNFFCVAFGGKPQPSISWWAGRRLVKNTSTPLSVRRVRIDLQYGPLRREDHGQVLSCRAKNNNVSIPLSVDITLDMHLAPQLVAVRAVELEGAGVRAGEALRLQCRVLGARPTPAIIWRINDNQIYNLEQNISVHTAQRLVVSEVQWLLVSEQDEASVSCCASAHRRGHDAYVCSEGLPLAVLYPPLLELHVNGEVENGTLKVIKGSDLTLNCTIKANPWIHDFIWYHGENVLNEKGKNVSMDQRVLHLSSISESDIGEYLCAGANAEGATTSEPLLIDVIYPPFCNDLTIDEYGLGENESMNLTCKVTGNPEPTGYRWMLVDSAVNITTIKSDQPCTIVETTDNVLEYTRTNKTSFGTVFCWGTNGVDDVEKKLPHSPCTFLITDETVPRPPTNCLAVKNTLKDITITCTKGHDGGLSQKFTLTVKSLESDTEIISVINLEPQFIIKEPVQEHYKFMIVAVNEKGDSEVVFVSQDDILDESKGNSKDGKEAASSVSNITTLSLALCGGVALLVLAACGLVLCARDGSTGSREPALCAYNTEDSNCDTCRDSDDGSSCNTNTRRTESVRRAASRGYDVRRTGSLHSAPHYPEDRDTCRVHSLQNITKKRDMEMMCDHLMMHLPNDMPNYNVPRSTTAFYTMPRKLRPKLVKEMSDVTSEMTHNSDGFSLPPPPDEFSSYRAGTRISARDVPRQLLSGKDSVEDKSPFSDVIISPMNTVGLPSISGQSGLYAYPDDDLQSTSTTARTAGVLSTFQSHYSSSKEPGF